MVSSVSGIDLGKGGERRLRLPCHVRVRRAVAAVERLDDAVGRDVEIIAWVAIGPVEQPAELEGEHERAVDAFGIEDVEQLAQVGDLLGFVALVDAIQADRQTVASSQTTTSPARAPRSPAPRYDAVPTSVIAAGLPCATRVRMPSR